MNATPSDILIKIENGPFGRFNGQTFQNLYWHIKKDQTWAITGPAGSGKTTLAEALTGKFPIREGQVTYNFFNKIQSLSEARKNIELVSFSPPATNFNYNNFYYQQRYNSSNSDLSITAQKFLEGSGDTDTLKIKEVTQTLRIENLLDLEVIKLSNGQTRKLLIARALLRKPALLILDSPYLGLDTHSRAYLDTIILNLIQAGTHIILITSQNNIPEYITHVLQLQNFAIAQKSTRAEYINVVKSKNSETKNFDFKANLFAEENNLADFKIAVQFENTSIKYSENLVLKDINWTVYKGEKWALVGPNGSGKTTLLSLINGDNPQAFANKITLFDKRKGTGESIWDIKKRIGFVSPELHLYFRQNMLAETVVATGFTDTLFLNRKLSEPEQFKLDGFFRSLNIESLLSKSFLTLSAGEQRLLLILRSLVKNPDLLIWDEPFQGLSSDLTVLATNLLKAYAQPNKTIILVSHYNQEIPDWVDNKIFLEEGKIKHISRAY